MNNQIEIDITQNKLNVETNEKINVVVHKTDLTNYYTIPETDLKFLSKEEAQNTYATISSVDELLDYKVDKSTYDDSMNMIKYAIMNTAYYSAPNKDYASLSALQTAFPSGASGVYLTSDNGHWYYWNGSAWTDGGVYQSSEDIEQIKEDLADIDYTLKNTEFKGFEISSESRDGGKWPEGGKVTFNSNKGYIAKSNGQVQNKGTGTWIYSDFIPIDRIAGEVGKFNLHASVACVSYYSDDSFSNYLGNLSITSEYNNTYTKEQVLENEPAGANYIVICTDGSRNELYATLTPDPAKTVTVIKNRKVYGNKFMHISFDDTNNAFKDLTDNASTYKSLFESPFFKVLKDVHDTYGCVFSCYCFYNVYADEQKTNLTFSLSNATTKFLNEFKANSNWMRFGFHSIDNYTSYLRATSETAKNDYETFINRMISVVGLESIDVVIRLQNFEGSKDACLSMRDSICGIRGLLASDYSETGTPSTIDTSTGYYLSEMTDATKICGRSGRYFDATNQLVFYPSSKRIDWNSQITEWLDSFNTADRFNRSKMMIIYGHENTMTRSEGDLSAYRIKLFTICEWAKANGYTFEFPMNLIN